MSSRPEDPASRDRAHRRGVRRQGHAEAGRAHEAIRADKDLHDAPFYRPADDSEEIQYRQERRRALGGYVPSRRVRTEPLPRPPDSIWKRYSDGVIRHNLGLEEAIYTVFVSAMMYLLARRPRPTGFFVGMLAVLYAPVRFLFDFLREVDVRYGGLTPGQWGAIAVLFVGLYILRRRFDDGAPRTATGSESAV